jgi:hypothetical protein
MHEGLTKNISNSNLINQNVLGLKCRDCGKFFEIGNNYVCDECFGALDVLYNEEKLGSIKKLLCLEKVHCGDIRNYCHSNRQKLY